MFKRAGLFLQLTVVAACGGGVQPAEPDPVVTMADVAGAYVATEFTATTGAQTIDQLRNGSSVQLVLAADGTWLSEFRIFPAETQTATGAWTLTGTQVRLVDFDQMGMPTTYRRQDRLLSGSHGFGVTLVRLTLRRS